MCSSSESMTRWMTLSWYPHHRHDYIHCVALAVPEVGGSGLVAMLLTPEDRVLLVMNSMQLQLQLIMTYRRRLVLLDGLVGHGQDENALFESCASQRVCYNIYNNGIWAHSIDILRESKAVHNHVSH